MILLIVDANLESRQETEALLMSQGHQVKSVCHGEEALAFLETERVDGILSEVLMPVMDGILLYRAVRTHDILTTIPFIFFTNDLDADDEPFVHALGADLIKKSHSHELAHVLSSMKERTLDKTLEEVDFFQKYSEILRKNIDKTLREAEKTQKKLTQSEIMYQKLFSESKDAAFILSREGRHLEANPEALQLLGYTLEELKTLSYRDTVVPSDLPDSEEKLMQLLKGEELPLYEKRFRTKSGRVIPVEISVSGIRDESGNVKWIQSIVRDITERKRTEEELNELHQFLEQIIDDASVWLDVLDCHGNVLIWNKAAEEISGYSREEVVGTAGVWELLYPDPEYRERVVETRTTPPAGEKVENFETVITCKNDCTKTLSWNFRTLLDERGIRTGSLSIGRDMTDQKKAEEEIAHRLVTEEAVARVAQIISSLESTNFDEVLRIVGEAVSCDRAGIFELKDGIIYRVYEWYSVRTRPQKPCLHHLDTTQFTWWISELEKGEITIFDVDALPFEASAEKEKLKSLGVQSVVMVPIHSPEKSLAGVMGFVDTEECRKWTEEDVRALRMVAEMISVYWERMRAEELSRESEEKYRDTVELAPDGIVIVSLEGVVTSCNTAFATMMGFSREEIIGHHFTSLPSMHEENIPEYLELFTSLIQEETLKPFEISWLCQGETPRFGEVHFSLMKKGGTVTGVQAIIMDITERKKTEEELHRYRQHLEELVEERTSELKRTNQQLQQEIYERKSAEESLAEEKERLAVTLRSIGDGVITTDTEGTIVLINKAGEILTGWSQEEAQGNPLNQVFCIIHEKTRELCEDPIKRVLTQGFVTDLGTDTVLLSKDGTEVLISDSGAPIMDKDSNIIGAVIVFRDITEKRKMEQELLKTQKLESIGVLAGGIAHDFNNILTAILSNTSLAKVQTTDNSIADKLARVESATLQAKDLTDQLLTFSKGGAPIKRVTSVAAVVKESVQFALRGSNVRCHFYVPDDLWQANVDAGQVSQVINNVVINALQAMPGGGDIKVRAENVTLGEGDTAPLTPGNYVKISIQDQGVGIPEKYLSRVFDPYFTTKKRGSGLGLATCYSIVKQHSGYIDVESEMGVGTTIHMWLPASGEEKGEYQDLERGRIEKVTVLLMDDEDIVLDAAGEVLTYLGYTVVTAKDGREAVELYTTALRKGEPFNVVIMDLTIPGGIGGKEAVQELLEVDPHVKVIVSSGYSTDPVMADYRAYGFRGVVTKPYSMDELSRTLRKVLTG